MYSGSVFDQTWLLLMETSSMSAGARVALFVLAGLLVLILGFLILFGAVLRRRAKSEPAETRTSARVVFESRPLGELEGAEYSTGGRSFARASAGGALEVAQSDLMVCPTCRREYDSDLSYCPHDARRLIAASEMLEPGRDDGSVCPSCKRSYDPGVRFCPHDASELTSVAVYTVTASPSSRKPTGVIAKICPQCQRRFDLSATFCSRDSTELVVIN